MKEQMSQLSDDHRNKSIFTSNDGILDNETQSQRKKCNIQCNTMHHSIALETRQQIIDII